MTPLIIIIIIIMGLCTHVSLHPTKWDIHDTATHVPTIEPMMNTVWKRSMPQLTVC